MQPDSPAPTQGKSIMHLIRPTASSKALAPRIQYTLQQMRAIGSAFGLRVPLHMDSAKNGKTGPQAVSVTAVYEL